MSVPSNLLRNKLGRKTAFYYLLRQLAIPADWFLGQALLKLARTARCEEGIEPIFIIGLPRSGTTLLYQYLSCVCDVTYTSTLWSILPRSAPSLDFILNQIPPLEFDSFFGNGGCLRSVSEGKNIMNRIVRNKDGVEKQRATDYARRVVERTGRPWLIKDVRNCVRLSLLFELFPKAKYIWLRRRLSAVAQSISLGRQTLRGSCKSNWTMLPENWQSAAELPYPEQIAHQVFLLERQVERSLRSLDQRNVIEVDYHGFCSAPFRVAAGICQKFEGIRLRDSMAQCLFSMRFIPSDQRRIPLRDYERIENELRNLSAPGPLLENSTSGKFPVEGRQMLVRPE
jgi:hypothetical protein